MHFPSSLPSTQRDFLQRALPILQANAKVVGIAAAGSYIDNTLDQYSDLDLVIAVEPDALEDLLSARHQVLSDLGDMVAGFSGEHVGEPKLYITLFAPEALHVDFKFVAVDDIGYRVDNPVILWARDARFARALANEEGQYPPLDLQWIEDRFWVWIHYATLKIGRGEYFETLDFLSFLRTQVLGPLALHNAGLPPRGVRRIEQHLPEAASALVATIAGNDKHELILATTAAAELYLQWRDPSVISNNAAQQLAGTYLASLTD